MDGSPEQIGRFVARMGNLRSRHGTFMVSGNHDYYSGWERWVPHLEQLGFQLLRNRRVSVGDGADSSTWWASKTGATTPATTGATTTSSGPWRGAIPSGRASCWRIDPPTSRRWPRQGLAFSSPAIPMEVSSSRRRGWPTQSGGTPWPASRARARSGSTHQPRLRLRGPSDAGELAARGGEDHPAGRLKKNAMTPDASKTAGFSAEKRRVALHSMLAAAAMTLLKLAAGLLSGSLGVLSDAAHSGLDMVGSTLTFFSVQVSDRPADEDHTYGHGKFENFSSFGEVLLMAVSSGWIIWEAIQRILHHRTAPLRWPVRWYWPRSASIPAVAAAARGGDRTGRRRWPPTPSTLPPTSGRRWRCWPGWEPAGWARSSAFPAALADPLAAVLVRVILRLTLRLGQEAVGVLLDQIPAQTRR